MEPATPPRQQLTRDQIIQIHALRSIGHTYEAIASHLSITVRSVQYACQREHPTPIKRPGRPSQLNDTQIGELLQYVTYSKQTRRQSYLALSQAFSQWKVGEYVIRTCLRKLGFKRYVARRKPPISEANRCNRLAWAIEHRSWTREQWYRIFWTDETWVTGGRHTRTWVTRRQGEELDPTCIVERIPRKRGWMFWAGFNGTTKGPCLFWEKDWGTINQESYSSRIVPLIHGWLRMNPTLVLMQDGAPGHAGAQTIQELRERGVIYIEWPAYSPDLNPIETVWNWMKDHVTEKYPEKTTYEQLRMAVLEAWESITPDMLRDLLDSMPARCEAVIAANGMHTMY